MMIKRIIAILAAISSLIAMCGGCQLAVSGKGTAANTDALCGMFITLMPLDTIPDNDIDALLNGVPDSNGSEEKPIYAKTQEYQDGTLKYEFEGIEGIPFFEVCEKAGGRDGNTWVNCSDDSVEVSVHLTNTGTNDSIKLEGILYLYVSPDSYNENGDFVIYCNPVYQSPDNQVYMLPGSGLGVSSEGDYSEDASQINVGSSISGTATVKEGDETKSKTIEASISVRGIKDIQKYVLKEMNAQDAVVSSVEITKNDIPGSLPLDGQAAYLILEAYSVDKGGKTVIERSVIDTSLDNFSVRFPGKAGFAKKYNITMNNKPI